MKSLESYPEELTLMINSIQRKAHPSLAAPKMSNEVQYNGVLGFWGFGVLLVSWAGM